MSTNRRKHRGGADDSSRPRNRNRLTASGTGTSSESESAEIEESGNLFFQPEITDITEEPPVLVDRREEPSDPEVINLTQDDSVVIVEGNLGDPQEQDIYIVISNDEDEPSDDDDDDDNDDDDDDDDDVPPVTIRCPICLDHYLEILESGRLIMSTMCGHVFCSQCLDESLNNANFCPTCRTETFHEECHPIYI